jgi:DNA-binding CsgD family transcriptional regulator
MLSSGLGALLDVAAAGVSLAQYEAELFAALDACVGFDVGFCLRADGFGPCTPGFDAGVRRAVEGQITGYGAELERVKRAAVSGGGVAVDRAVLGGGALERTRIYRDVMRPHRGRASLHVYLGSPQAPAVLLVLGRCRGDFRAAELQLLARARSLLTVCERALQMQPTGPVLPKLTPRELEILTYLRLGYSNPQIAAASGRSFRTVRNQLSLIFDKLEVGSRAEAVARSYQLQLPV